MKKIKQMAALGSLLIGSGVVVAQDVFDEFEDPALAEANQSLYQEADKNPEDDSNRKAFGNGYYSLFLPASGATEINTSEGYRYIGGGCMRATTGAKSLDMAVQIPDGHRIHGFRYYWYDNDSSAVSDATLYKFNDIGGSMLLGQMASSDNVPGYNSGYRNIANHIVDNSTGSYVIRFYSSAANSNIRMCGVRLSISAF